MVSIDNSSQRFTDTGKVIVSLYLTLSLECLKEIAFIICPMAEVYSMGQIIKSVCVSQSVCPSVGTFTVAFLDRSLPKLSQT